MLSWCILWPLSHTDTMLSMGHGEGIYTTGRGKLYGSGLGFYSEAVVKHYCSPLPFDF